MAIKVAVGNDDFDSIIHNGSYYIDKTELLYELLHETDNLVTLFTRPRRFGKTLTMRMLESFFDISRDSRSVFQGLDIMNHEEFCQEWMNQYPVLFVSFKDVEALTFSTAYEKLKSVIADVCKRYSYLADNELTDPFDREIFQNLHGQKGTEADIQNSLKIIMRMMKAVHGKPVIVLIDEYDVPIAKANENREKQLDYYTHMLSIMRGILSTSLKSNEYLKFGIVTGCLQIAKESIFTGLNNFKSYSILDRRFSRYFGFTCDEVEKLLEEAELSEHMGIVRSWYDGYIFGNTKVFCPWDVVNYVADAMEDPDLEPENYWKNTSSNGIIRSFVERTDFDVSGKFETLMNGGVITEAISSELTYDTLHESENHLWSVLLMTGYLTKADTKSKKTIASLKIPNQEIAGIFQDTVVKFFSDHVEDEEQRSMMEALWNGDEEVASKSISDLLWQTISFMDYHEDYYHAFLAGIFVGRGYEVESNKEHGLGRPDIKLTDKRNHRALIIEAKKSDSVAHMPHDCEEALKQIVDREYAKGLEDYHVTSYGVAFFRKSALVKKL